MRAGKNRCHESVLWHVDSRTQLYVGVIISALLIISMWVLPIAPLADWPIHLAMAQEAYLIWTGQLVHNFYYLDFSFLGYSFMYISLMLLQTFFSIETSGKIVLSVLVLLTPLSWRFFLSRLDPKKTPLFVAGFLMFFSWPFYAGWVSFLYAVDFGLIFLAIGLNENRWGKKELLAMVAFGIFAYMAHLYVFFLCVFVILANALYEIYMKNKPLRATYLLPTLALISLAAINTIEIPQGVPDISFYKAVQACVSEKVIMAENLEWGVSYFGIIWRLAQSLDITTMFPGMFLLDFLKATLILLTAGFVTFLGIKTLADEKAAEVGEIIKSIKIEPRYFAIAAAMLLHTAIIPHHMVVQDQLPIGVRSIPLLIAFAIIAFKFERAIKILFYAIAILAALNAGYMAHAFWEHAPGQAQIIEKLEQISEQIPDGSAAFIVPAKWNLALDYNKPLYENPGYHSVLLMQKPSLYISGQFLYPPSTILRSSFPLYDEMRLWDKPDNMTIFECYSDVPSQYGWIIDENMTLGKNDK